MAHSLKTLLYQTIHRSHKSAAQIADESGMSYSYLCRTGLPTDESGVTFPLEKLVPVMRSASDYSVLKYVAMLCGFLLVKAPRGVRNRMEEAEAVNTYTALCTCASKGLMDFFRSPSPALMQRTIDALEEVMECSAGLQRRIKDHNQRELEL